mmetsp:Transcript_47905/g.136829  ORF Transcript_47905/g.136829 Transcript_47905/m.136829 type:complete len:88 (-) Transcript_47905:1652-1915(-)
MGLVHEDVRGRRVSARADDHPTSTARRRLVPLAAETAESVQFAGLPQALQLASVVSLGSMQQDVRRRTPQPRAKPDSGRQRRHRLQR